MDTATIDRVTTEDILRFIDGWLDEHAWKAEGDSIDLALDLRRLIVGLSK